MTAVDERPAAAAQADIPVAAVAHLLPPDRTDPAIAPSRAFRQPVHDRRGRFSVSGEALTDAELHRLIRYWNAANYLTVGQIYLRRQPAAATTAAARAHQAAAARALGHVAGAQPDLRPPEPADPPDRAGRALRRRPGSRRAGAGRQRLPRGHVQRDLPAGLPGRGRAAAPGPPVLHARRASPATSACRPRARSTRAASSATR